MATGLTLAARRGERHRGGQAMIRATKMKAFRAERLAALEEVPTQ